MSKIIIKKDGTRQKWNSQKIISAIDKSAERVNVKLTDLEKNEVVRLVEEKIKDNVTVSEIHTHVEQSLEKVSPQVAMSYREFRNYKTSFGYMMNNVIDKRSELEYRGDISNANTDSALLSTKRSLTYTELNKQLYKKLFLNSLELEAIHEGTIYVHDIGSRNDTFNCCLFNFGEILSGGFEMGNMWYTEPKTFSVAMDVLTDVVLAASAQQYGGLTLPEIDTVLSKYVEMSYDKHIKETEEAIGPIPVYNQSIQDHVEKVAWKRLEREVEQGIQAMEYKLNSLSSSRGDFPFVSISFGLGTDKFSKLINQKILEVRMNGQGKPGFKRPVLFPKLIFLYDENLHGTGKVNEDIFDTATVCSSKSMYPDYLSLTGDNYEISEVYKESGLAISPMGCRSFLGKWYKEGGFEPAHENDEYFFKGRGNAGVVSLNLPLIYTKAMNEKRDFYELIDESLEMIRNIHQKTRTFLSKLKASVSPLHFVEGGLSRLNPEDTIESVVDTFSYSFGVTALAELEILASGEEWDGAEDQFTYKTLKYIYDRVQEMRNEDRMGYSLYGTPAESLCHTQAEQYKKYCEENNIDIKLTKDYFSNSFHIPVWRDITPVEKQDKEELSYHLCGGGQIQYVRYPNGNNINAIKTLVKRAMKKGYYEGVNIQLDYCDDCGHEFSDGHDGQCPKCGSTNYTEINRISGYLGFSRIKGKSRINEGKISEIKDRKSM